MPGVAVEAGPRLHDESGVDGDTRVIGGTLVILPTTNQSSDLTPA